MQIIRVLSSGCLALVLLTASASVYAQHGEKKCSKKAEAAAKEHYDRAEAYKTLKKYPEAASEYQTAFDTCARAFLLFNAGQMLWLDGKKDEALQRYERYLEMEPQGRAAKVAREQFFEAAEDLRKYKKLEPALKVYERYLELAPDGDNAGAARVRVDELRAALQTREDAAKAEAERQAAAERARAERDAAERAQRDRPEGQQPTPVKGRSLDWKPLAVAGSGLAITIVGGLLHAQAISAGTKYDDEFIARCPAGCSPDSVSDLEDMLASARTKQRIAIASYAVGGVALSAGVVWFLMTRGNAAPANKESTEAAFVPLVGPRIIGGAWHARF